MAIFHVFHIEQKYNLLAVASWKTSKSIASVDSSYKNYAEPPRVRHSEFYEFLGSDTCAVNAMDSIDIAKSIKALALQRYGGNCFIQENPQSRVLIQHISQLKPIRVPSEEIWETCYWNFLNCIERGDPFLKFPKERIMKIPGSLNLIDSPSTVNMGICPQSKAVLLSWLLMT